MNITELKAIRQCLKRWIPLESKYKGRPLSFFYFRDENMHETANFKRTASELIKYG